jgi:hypothetical protein
MQGEERAICFMRNSLFVKRLSRTNRLGLASFVGLTAVMAVVGGRFIGNVFSQSDVAWYLKIAQGQTSTVLAPFSYRELDPLIARALAYALRIDIHTAFIVEGVFWLFLLLGIVGSLLIRAGTDPILVAAVAGLSLWPILFYELALPDLCFAALLAIFLLLLAQDQYLACALMFFPLWMSREATIVVLVCFFAAGWRQLRPLHYLAAIATSIAGMSVIKNLAAGGPGNQEKLGGLLYTLGKVLWNGARNVIGIVPWMNLRTDFCAVPAWEWHVHLGRITSVGICGWDLIQPVWVIRLGLATFGLLPVLLVYFWRENKEAFWPESPMLRFCLLYGLLSSALAPVLGTGTIRFFAYAWPLFSLAVPIIVSEQINVSRTALAGPLVAHILLSWTLVLIGGRLNDAVEIMTLALVGVTYACAWILLRRSRVPRSRAHMPG